MAFPKKRKMAVVGLMFPMLMYSGLQFLLLLAAIIGLSIIGLAFSHFTWLQRMTFVLCVAFVGVFVKWSQAPEPDEEDEENDGDEQVYRYPFRREAHHEYRRK